MRVQKSNSASVMNAVRSYGQGVGALLLITSDDTEIASALARVFEIHQAPEVSPELDLPWQANEVGDCRISDDGVLLTVEGSGDSFMGLRFEVSWGATDGEWRAEAERNGCAWLILVPDGVYGSLAKDPFALIPSVPVLKLGVQA